jgi:hypothetical protein
MNPELSSSIGALVEYLYKKIPAQIMNEYFNILLAQLPLYIAWILSRGVTKKTDALYLNPFLYIKV